MAKKNTNPFAMFANNEVKTAKIKALNGAEIKYRELTLRENDEFNTRMVKDFDASTGENPIIDIEEATAIKYEKVALMLIEPKMTADQLHDLPASASGAIDEILDLQKSGEEDLLDTEGN
jgi:hypothetical protein